MKKFISLFIFTLLIVPGVIACTGNVTQPSGSGNPTATANSTPASVPSTVTVVIQDYYKAIEKHDYTKAYSYVEANGATANGQKLTLTVLKQMATEIEDAEGPIQSFNVAAFPSEVVMTIVRQKLGPYHTHIQVKQVGGTWKITSIDRV